MGKNRSARRRRVAAGGEGFSAFWNSSARRRRVAGEGFRAAARQRPPSLRRRFSTARQQSLEEQQSRWMKMELGQSRVRG
ncbi:unnamed protein product [Linum trigynum]|uniref:Uncharacterized protein n=1 Tax=Linum trigynum TaxID=586398 RepID=A0AAV2E0I4_9ROSI